MKKYSYVLCALLVSAFLIGTAYAQEAGEGGDYTSPFDEPTTESATTEEGPPAEEATAEAPTETTTEESYTEEEKKTKLELPAKRLIKVVQKRLYKKDFKHLLYPYYAIMPFGDFYTTHQAGLKYNFYFTENLGLQLNFAYTFYATPTELLASTLKNLRGDPQGVPAARMDWFGSAEFVFVPVYGKFSLLSEVIVHYDFGIYLGGGAARFKSVSGDDITYINENYGSFGEPLPPGLADEWSKISPALDLGVFAQIYILNWLLVRFDFNFVESLTTKRVFDVSKQKMTDSDKFGIENYIFTLGVGFLLPPD